MKLRQALDDQNLSHLNESQVEQVLESALAEGGQLSELFFEETESTRVSFEDGKVDRIVDGRDRGCGVRVIYDGRYVYGYSTDLAFNSLKALASNLAVAVKNAQQGKSGARPGHRMGGTDWRASRASDPAIGDFKVRQNTREVSLEEKVNVAKRMDAAARVELPQPRQVSAVIVDTWRRTLVVNSDGLFASNKKTYLSLIAEVVGEKNGRVESAHEVAGTAKGFEFLSETHPEAVGQEAARKVKVLLDAKPAPSGQMPVVMAAEAGGTMIHEAVGHGLEADLACEGLSVYQNKVGQQVASELITVIDDGTLPGYRGSYAFDDEGNPSKKTVLIENGVLKGYMVDRICAMKFDLMATGNGRRETFRHRPMVRMTNTYVAPGPHDPQSILRETEWGIFVKGVGGGQVDTVTGDYVFAVTEGYLIENGKLTHPIRGATLVGNGPKTLMQVDRVGSDLGFAVGTCGKSGQGAPVTDAIPTLRMQGLTVGGEVPVSTYWPERG